ncbi:hypothetical protein PL11_003750 [Lentilactobacillus curieae]|uniref:Uncharacterized protein n=1 Tax=Lentilactobacillus curieae TaxID=1138822 RepID=A0A1S6QHN2_9LACO|nr:hypothetical protein PL11_003750 [Lentilactobacillus curieae]
MRSKSQSKKSKSIITHKNIVVTAICLMVLGILVLISGNLKIMLADSALNIGFGVIYVALIIFQFWNHKH